MYACRAAVSVVQYAYAFRKHPSEFLQQSGTPPSAARRHTILQPAFWEPSRLRIYVRLDKQSQCDEQLQCDEQSRPRQVVIRSRIPRPRPEIVDPCAAISVVSNKQSQHTYTHFSGKQTTVLHHRSTSSVPPAQISKG